MKFQIGKLILCVCMTVISLNLNISHSNAEMKTEEYKWSRAYLGGGGYITGIKIHPNEPGLMYARSDVGGLFRWIPEEGRWLQLMDSMGAKERNQYGIDGMALDPNDPNVIYVAAAKYQNKSNISDVYKSSDRGETWIRTNLNKEFIGNAPYRWAGECIAIDPNNSNVVYAGSRSEGLYRTNDGAETWEQVSDIPSGRILTAEELPNMQVSSYATGTRSVVFDPASEKNGVSQIIYASVLGEGIYQTKDAGNTWSLMDGSPKLVARMEAASDGTIFMTTFGNGVRKYKDGKWIDISPITEDSDSRFCGLSIDPNNEKNIIVSAWDNIQDPTCLPIYRSKNGGISWDTVSVTAANNRKFAPGWFPEWFFLSATSQVAFDPYNPGQVYAADWYSVWRTPNIWAEPADSTQWYAECRELETTCMLGLAAPTVGANLLSAGADVGLNRHIDLSDSPKTGSLVSSVVFGNANSVDFCESNPNYVVVTASKFHDSAGVFAVSSDNGETFTEIKAPNNERNGRVAYSATDINKIVWVPQSGAPIVTTDRGQTWQKTS
ncbi:MAG: hypothetical protein J6N52_04945, partial [Clostridia bacterium]|nr:hypothetical protein [Clostridia bacterium]